MTDTQLEVGVGNPFAHYRQRLDSYRAAVDGGLSDAWFLETVERLDSEVAAVAGQGFRITPVSHAADLAATIGHAGELWVKDETANVGGSHKARHLFGVALHLLVAEQFGQHRPRSLAIASCGNAALGAAIVAAAMKRRIDVFVPEWAAGSVVELLRDLDAEVHRCPRRVDEFGDPCYHRFTEAVDEGAEPFSVQGTDTSTTFDGGRTLGWELVDQVPHLATLYVQVGGGALATAVSMGAPGVQLMPVQAEGAAPLRKAWDRLAPDFDLDRARLDPARYMEPWPEPSSAATGILDDITYDWIALLDRTLATGGEPVVAPEATIVEAHVLAERLTGIRASATGTAGLAGLMTRAPDLPNPTAVIFTGVER